VAKTKLCGNCKFFRKLDLCPRQEWKPEFKNRWGMHLNHIACLPSDSACELFQPKKRKQKRNAKRVFERMVEALQ